MTRHLASFTVVLLALTTEVGAASGKPAVARIGSYELSSELFDMYWSTLPPQHREHYEQAGGKRAFLDDVIEQKLLALEAERRGLHQLADVQAALDNARDTLLGRKLLDEAITNQIVDAAAIKQYYDDHKEGFRIPEMLRARHILVTPHAETSVGNSSRDDATTDEAAKAKIERLANELKAGADFAELARKWSEDITADKGGLIDDFPRGRMAKPFEEAVFALKPGEVSGVVRTPYGFHLIKLEARTPTSLPPLAELEERIKIAVAQERKDSFQPRLDELWKAVREQFPVVIDESLLPRSAASQPTASQPAATQPTASQPTK